MKYWFVVHDLMAYSQHNDMIGCRVKEKGLRTPKFAQFAEIQKGDKIVYYATRDKVVVGIFDVVSDMEYLANDPYWNEIIVFSIKPIDMPPEGYYLDFKKFIDDENVQLSLFPKKKIWARYLQGKTCRKLTQNDFEKMRSYLQKSNYLVETKMLKLKKTRWHMRERKIGKAKEVTQIHQKMVERWMEKQRLQFGPLRPTILSNVDLNRILPESTWLHENTKQIDGLSILEFGGLPVHKAVLEVHHKGVREDTVVRIAIILPFVDHIDIVGAEEDISKIRELLYRIADNNVLRARVEFHTFREYLA